VPNWATSWAARTTPARAPRATDSSCSKSIRSLSRGASSITKTRLRGIADPNRSRIIRMNCEISRLDSCSPRSPSLSFATATSSDGFSAASLRVKSEVLTARAIDCSVNNDRAFSSPEISLP
jgi:hypothetical protein